MSRTRATIAILAGEQHIPTSIELDSRSTSGRAGKGRSGAMRCGDRGGDGLSVTPLMERPLDRVETAAMNIAPTQIADFQGTLDEELMARAVQVLSGRFPVLRARVRRDGQQYSLVVTSDEPAGFAVLDGGEKALAREAASPWDPERGVARLFAVRGHDGGALALRMDHAVMNGHGWTTIFYELWQLYTDLVEGRGLTVDPGPGRLPRAPTELLRERWQGYDASEEEGPPAAKVLHGVHQHNVVLSAETTRDVLAVAKAAGQSVHALICGAALTAQRAVSGASQTVRMGCISPVDLRHRVEPPVEATDVTNFHRAHLGVLDVSPADTAIAIGHQVKQQLDLAVARNELPRIDTGRISSSLDDRFAVAMVSNLGRMRAIVTPPGLSIRDWRRLADVVPTIFPAHATYTYAGRLTLISYFPSDLYTADESGELSARLVAQLLSPSG
jgi:phenolphthiocerol/phthiocerol/phthiodiolone dimycocerosyl transferase